jgi:hypothetical protein
MSSGQHRAVTAGPVHFYNILVGKPACLPPMTGEQPDATVEPALVTCPECLRYLLHKEDRTAHDGDAQPIPAFWGSKVTH